MTGKQRAALRKMANPLETKTITLSCGKLTTGVTVRPWTGVFMLRNLKSPETYFQTAFRVQSPWTVNNENGENEIIKTSEPLSYSVTQELTTISQGIEVIPYGDDARFV